MHAGPEAARGDAEGEGRHGEAGAEVSGTDFELFNRIFRGTLAFYVLL